LAKAIIDNPSWLRIAMLIGLANNHSYVIRLPHPSISQVPKLWLPLSLTRFIFGLLETFC